MQKTIQCFIVIFLLVMGHTTAQIIYVDIDATGTNDGSTWANAYTNLTTAITASVAGNEIWIAEGTYFPDSDAPFNVVDGVNLYGGFSGTETTIGERDLLNNQTILDGDIGIVGNASDNSKGVLYGNGLVLPITIDGFVIRNGTNPFHGGGITLVGEDINLNNLELVDNYSDGYGGGIYLVSTSITIDNCIFSSNSTGTVNIPGGGSTNIGGGGLYVISNNATITNCTFNNNYSNFGGGLFYTGNNSQISNCVFLNNTGISGGGLFVGASQYVSLSNLTFNNNSTSYTGGGCIIGGSYHSVNNLIFNNNSTDSWGGGLYIYGRDSSFNNLILNNNSCTDATSLGGGMYIYNSRISFNNVIMKNNNSNYYGGGIYMSGDDLLFTNAVFDGNYSSITGGALYADNALNLSLKSVTLTNNVANGLGSGIYLNNSNLDIQNSVIYNNQFSDIFISGASVVSATNSFTQQSPIAYGNPSGATQLVANPFTNSADPDGLDNILGTSDDGLIPLLGSVLIDAGNNTANTETIDIKGDPRIFNSTIDVGAYEVQSMLSINKQNTELAKVYPNPANNTLFVHLKYQVNSVSYQLTNIIGQIILEGEFTNTISVLNMSALKNGMYVLTINDNNKTESIKIIKK